MVNRQDTIEEESADRKDIRGRSAKAQVQYLKADNPTGMRSL